MLVASGEDCMNRCILRYCSKLSTVEQDLMSDGSRDQKCPAANSLCILGTVSSGASDDCRGRTRTAVWIRSHTVVEEDIVLNVSVCQSMLDWQPVERPEKWSGIRPSPVLVLLISPIHGGMARLS